MMGVDGKEEMCAMLHLGEFGNLALLAGARVVPELEAIGTTHDL
jgi:hypothetical protein